MRRRCTSRAGPCAGGLTRARRSGTDHGTKDEREASGCWGPRQGDAGGPVGRLNDETQSVDMAPAVNPSTLADPDVVQNDANVVLYSNTTNMLAQVAVAQSANRPAGQRLGPNVADASPGADAGKASVGQHRYFVAP